jgi:tetratricopeptide (TPR) repeat protein
MRFRLFIVVILTFAKLSVMAQAVVLQGPDYFIEEQYGKARDWYLQRLKNPPVDTYIYTRLGDTYLALNNADSAGIAYQNALDLDLKNPFAMAGLGKIALMQNNLAGESEYFDRARRADKLNAVVYCYIAEGCLNLSRQDTATARIFLDNGLNVDPKNARLHMISGDLASLKKRYGEAVNAYQRAVFFDPRYALAYRKLGVANNFLQNYPDALKAFNKSVEINPMQILVYRDLGNLYYATGRYAEAVNAYQTFMSRSEITMDDKERYAILLFFNRRYDEASALLKQVLAVGKNESGLLRLEGYIAYETGEYQKGLESMNKFFALHNQEKIIPTDYIYYARILVKTGKDSLAMISYKKAIDLDPLKTDIYEELAKLAAKNNKHAEAAEYYRKMGDKGADKIVSIFLAGKEYYFEGNNWKMRYDSLIRVQKKRKVAFTDSTYVRQSMKSCYIKADSAFTLVNQLNNEYAGGFLWKGRVQSLLDPEAENPGARDAYENALSILQKGDQESNKKMIIECYRYLGYYYFREYERIYRTNKLKSAESRSKSIEYFSKIIKLDPTDKQANEVIQKMKQT